MSIVPIVAAGSHRYRTRSCRWTTNEVFGAGVCWDNAAAETFFATLKNEMYYRHIFATKARARFAVAEYIEAFYNRKRMHSSIGYRTPAQALNDYHSAALAA